jgi:hypothetical protein
MQNCSICLESFNNMVNLTCTHLFCSDCLFTWRQRSNSCPICRQHIELESSHISVTGIELSDTPISIGFNSPSEKGSSAPIEDEEFNILRYIFSSNFENVNLSQFINNDYINNKIMIQDYLSNGWWIGIVVFQNNNSVKLDQAIRIHRENGRMYNCSPTLRNINLHNSDLIYTFN